MKILVIDDIRTFAEAEYHARTYAEGIDALTEEEWDILYLDHDLGEDKSGYDVLCFLEEYPEYLPGEIQLVTANPVGRMRMVQVINKLYNKE